MKNIRGLDILANEIIEKKTFDVKGDNTNFISIIPHSGLIIPEIMLEYFYLDQETRNEMINDSDPFTDLFKLDEIGGKSFIYNIHRVAGDSNRYTNDKKFMGGKSFRGGIYLKKQIELKMFQYISELADSYSKEIGKHIKKHQEKTKDPLLLIHVHSMEELDPFYKTERPDICLSVGYDNMIISEKLQHNVIDCFKKIYSNDFNIQVNNPFTGIGEDNRIIHEHSNPKDNIHSFMIEFNKRIYMDGFKLNKEKFEELKLKLHSAINNFLDYINRE